MKLVLGMTWVSIKVADVAKVVFSADSHEWCKDGVFDVCNKYHLESNSDIMVTLMAKLSDLHLGI